MDTRYWRTRDGREVDFVLVRPRDEVGVIECKWNAAEFDSGALEAFRRHYPRGRNYLVTPLQGPAHARRFGGLEVSVCAPDGIEAARDVSARTSRPDA